jgi:hypothetical protein
MTILDKLFFSFLFLGIMFSIFKRITREYEHMVYLFERLSFYSLVLFAVSFLIKLWIV